MQPSNYLRITFLVTLLLLMGACEKDITSEVKINSQPMLVVTSFISPQDTGLVVKVSKTRPAVGVVTSNSAKVTDATVSISNGTRAVRLNYDATRDIYWTEASTLPILPGETYLLTVSTPDGAQVTASCTVPVTEGIAFTKLEHSITTESYEGQGDYYRHSFDFQWQDAAGQENYYHALSLLEYFEPGLNRNRRLPLDNYGEKVFFSDEKQDGQLFASVGKFQYSSQDVLPSPLYLEAHLSVTDRPYYLYHESIEKQNQTNGNPFAEPVIIYTNIQGGLGVFAAYNQIRAVKQIN